MGERAQIRLEERAARQDWPLDVATQADVMRRLADLIAQEGQKPRTITAAARALAALGALALRQQQQDRDGGRDALPPGQLDLRHVVESDWYQEVMVRENSTGPAAAPAEPEPTAEALAWLEERRQVAERIRAQAPGTGRAATEPGSATARPPTTGGPSPPPLPRND